ncbi:MAG: Hpt domain-containing protein [Magnetococcales bacterium]|nr:Hpt domain-containing protein [Magnetococcales bacterium]
MPVDMAKFMNTVGDDWDLAVEVMGLYLADAPTHMEAIQKALADKDAPQIHESAHSLKGASGVFGDVGIARLAKRMEELGKNGTLKQADALFKEMQDALADLSGQLHAAMKRNKP